MLVAESERSAGEPASSIEDRYEVQRTLGQGAAGIVYEVRDRETGERLALKKLLRVDLQSVLRMKQEFRALADLHHPNLIKLYDFGRADDAWFITMERLYGLDLMAHLNGEADLHGTARLVRPANQNAAPGSLRRLCNVFLQLARGVRALHRAGMLHCDLKPSNVIVADDRVVVLDFGLVRGLSEQVAPTTHEGSAAGTPAYMAPEQVRNEVLTPAVDWYAFGVMLYEALSGALPIDGKLYELLQRKLDTDPKPIQLLVPGVPVELATLCMALLRRDPAERPGFDAIMAVLGSLVPEFDFVSEIEPVTDILTSQVSSHAFVGRDAELLELERALDESARGRLVVTHVCGAAGVGKSALLEHFLLRLESSVLPGYSAVSDMLILRARCYEREAMPFKALDGLLDTLVTYLTKLDELVVSHMLPVHLEELARAFPVLERLPAAKRLLVRSAPRGDAARERSRAELALKDLLRRVAAHKQLVLWIDDLQWADLDSVRVLSSWLELDEALPLLLVFCYRSGEEDNACLKLLSESGGAGGQALTVKIDLAPLPASDVELLCMQGLGEHAAEQAKLIARIVAETHGSPFLARQLLTLAQARLAQGEDDLRSLSIHSMMVQVNGLLSEEQRMLLRVLAVAGRPVGPQLLLRAARIRRGGRAALHALHGLGLTRVRIVNGQRLFEVYHDRVREVVVAALTEVERVQAHTRLLSALERSGSSEPDWLHTLAVGAEQNTAAVRYGLLAAERAAAGLAFERAAELYDDCLKRSPEAAQSGELWCKFGDALAACGRSSRAARAYAEAARLGPSTAHLELTHRAAIHYILSGHFEEGEQLVREVLDGLGESVPQTEQGIIAAFLWEQLRLKLRGLEFEPQPDAPTRAEYLRASMYASFSLDTQSYHPLRAALFQARSLRLALDVGASRLVAATLCVAATMRGLSGSPRQTRIADEMLARAQAIADRDDDPVLHVHIRCARAMCAFLLGKTADCVELSGDVERLYAVHIHGDGALPGEYYLRFVVRAARVGALFQLGRLRQASSELRQVVSDARAMESRTALLHLTMVRALEEITQNVPGPARARLDSERSQLPKGVFGSLHLLHVAAVLRVGCTLGDYAWTHAVLADFWPRLERSPVRFSLTAVLAYSSHARLLLNEHVALGHEHDPEPMLRRDMRAIAHASARAHPVSSTRLQARLAYLAGRRERAIALYREHVAICQRAQYLDEVERARWALGRVLGGTEGAGMCRDAEQRLRELGLAAPLAELPTHFPELAQQT